MAKINLTNAGLVLGAVAVFYVVYKSVKWNDAMTGSTSYDNYRDKDKQYAPAWSDRYDWMKGIAEGEKYETTRT